MQTPASVQTQLSGHLAQFMFENSSRLKRLMDYERHLIFDKITVY